LGQKLTRKKKNERQYSKGVINRLIDNALNSYSIAVPVFIVVDTVLHGLVEKNPNETVGKFAWYTLPMVIDEILKSH
jgi:hypothetical protein